jgi:hypothetical protein
VNTHTEVEAGPLKLEIVENLEYEEIEEQPEYDEDEDYDEDDDDDSSYEESVAEHTWGLDTCVNLGREAANFYLLMDLWLDGTDGGEFQRYVVRLADMFSRYADMVVGGELRYSLGQTTDHEAIHEKLRLALGRSGFHGSRSSAWDEWYSFRETHGTEALQWAEESFGTFGNPGSYGGGKWAYIARCVRMYEERSITPLIFVDMCWGLEHNGGQFFGKLWSSYALQTVLDANLQEDMATLLKYASPAVAKRYDENKECEVDFTV